MKMTGKKALVVGASSGIGLETARLFASEEAEITLVARSTDKLNELAKELGGAAHVVTADVADVASCQSIVPAAIEAMRGLDVVVYCSGICEPCLVKDMTIEDFKRHIDINLTGNFIVAQAAALYMNDHDGGSIVNISSELSHIGMGYYVHYCAVQGRSARVDQGLAAEMAPKVRVNSISPGPVDTPDDAS